MPKGPKRSLALSDESIAKIAKIREKSRAVSDSEVVRRALNLYESLLKETRKESSPSKRGR